jgi:hypothetical protein
MVADPLTVTVIADFAEPMAAMGLGLKSTFRALPCPKADKVIAEENPFSLAVVIVVMPDLPLATLIVVGDALMVKSGTVTVRVTTVVCLRPPPVPVTVIG